MAGWRRKGQQDDGVPQRRETKQLRGRRGEQEVVEDLPVVNRDAFDYGLLTVLSIDQGDMLAPTRLPLPGREGRGGRSSGESGGEWITVVVVTRTSRLGLTDLLVVPIHRGSLTVLSGTVIVLAAGASRPGSFDALVALRADAKRERRTGERSRHLRQQKHQG